MILIRLYDIFSLSEFFIQAELRHPVLEVFLIICIKFLWNKLPFNFRGNLLLVIFYFIKFENFDDYFKENKQGTETSVKKVIARSLGFSWSSLINCVLILKLNSKGE